MLNPELILTKKVRALDSIVNTIFFFLLLKIEGRTPKESRSIFFFMICLYEIHPYNKIKHVAIKIMYGPSIKFQTSVQERKGNFHRYTENNNENVQTCAYAVLFTSFIF